MANVVYSHGIPVPRVDDSKLYFYNRLTILYGPSGSGKSSLIQHILNTLRSVIPLIVVCCPTASLNGDYANIVPDQCIYDDVSGPLMKRIFQRQSSVLAMYDLVRTLENVKPLYRLVATRDSQCKVDRLDAIFRKGCSDIKASYEQEEIESAIGELYQKYSKKLVKIMRACIIANMARLRMFNLTDMQKTLLTNFEINPSILILIDDCMASIKEWKDLEETKKLFYQGRHYFVTTLISAQNDTSIPPPFRMNSHISLFTTQTIVNAYVNKPSSGIDGSERKKIARIAETIFARSDDVHRPNYKKLVIFGQIIKTDNKIQYIIGYPKKKKFGSCAMWAMCDRMKRETSLALSSHSFSKMFAVRPTPALESVP
jgi:energy-coupling factor transporter ATP-binding protein EcfA2